MSVPEELARTVRMRSGGRCQYCLMHESLQGATFHIEHVIPCRNGGRSDLENLVLSCPGCNLHKAARILVVDPSTGEKVRLFHPGLQLWSEHFRLNGYQIEGLNAVGRATVEALRSTEPERPSSPAHPGSRGSVWPLPASSLNVFRATGNSPR